MARVVAASSPAVRARRRARARSRFWSRAGLLALLAGVLAVGLGLVFAGSPHKLADGTRISGVDVGGLTPQAARRLLERRSDRLETVPVVFTFHGRRFPITPSAGVEVDWAAAVANARRQGDGFGFVRGYAGCARVLPRGSRASDEVYDAGLNYKLGLLAKAVDRPHREARLIRRAPYLDRRRRNRPLARPGCRASGDRGRARVVPRPSACRSGPIRRSTRSRRSPPSAPRRASFAPVTLVAGRRGTGPRWRLAGCSTLRRCGSGPAAGVFFSRLERQATGRPGTPTSRWRPMERASSPRAPASLDVPRSAPKMLAAATRLRNRAGTLASSSRSRSARPPRRRRWGSPGRSARSRPSTGHCEPDPQRSARRAPRRPPVHRAGCDVLLQRHDRRAVAAKGFLEAPVIVNGERRPVSAAASQVSTTVFNAAYEAGLPITPGRTTRSTSRTIRSGVTPRWTTPCRSRPSTTRSTGCCFGRTSVVVADCRVYGASAPTRRKHRGAAAWSLSHRS